MAETEQPRPLTFKIWLLARVIFFLERLIYRTLRLTVTGDEQARAILAEDGGFLITWHGRTIIPFNLYRGRGYWALISLSRDGDLQNEHVKLCGFQVIRGSTGRRGVAATRELLKQLAQGGIAALTPDGPRGPSEVVQTGVVYLAQKSGKPIIPGAAAAHPRWLMGTWDKYMIPKPFARAQILYGEPLWVLPGEDLETVAAQLTETIRGLQERAEAMCGASSQKPI